MYSYYHLENDYSFRKSLLNALHHAVVIQSLLIYYVKNAKMYKNSLIIRGLSSSLTLSGLF